MGRGERVVANTTLLDLSRDFPACAHVRAALTELGIRQARRGSAA